jgi:hypothetical protein
VNVLAKLDHPRVARFARFLADGGKLPEIDLNGHFFIGRRRWFGGSASLLPAFLKPIPGDPPSQIGAGPARCRAA